GFQASSRGPCAPGVQISQIYSGGGDGGPFVASFQRDFVELHNTGASDVNLDGFALQYTEAGQADWLVAPLPFLVVPGGGYVLIALVSGPFPAMSQLPL